MSLRLPGRMHGQNTAKPSRVAVLTRTSDMPVLLQQHQDDNERPVSRLPTAVRRLHYRVEDHLPRRVGPLHLPCLSTSDMEQDGQAQAADRP